MGTLKWEKQNLNCRSEKQDLFLEDSVLLYIKKEKNSNSKKTACNTEPLKGNKEAAQH